MATTPDDPAVGAGCPADPEAALSAAEAAHLAARDGSGAPDGTRPGTVWDGSGAPDGTQPGTARDGPGAAAAAQETVRLPRQRRGQPAVRRPPLALSAAVAATWAAVLSYLPIAMVVSLAQLAAGGGSVGGTARTAGAGWLLAHGVPLQAPTGPVGLAPLGLTLFAGWRLARAGLHTTRGVGARGVGSLSRAVRIAVAIGVSYGLLGALTAGTITGEPDASVGRSFLHLALFGSVAGLLGAARATGAVEVLARRTPGFLRDGLRTGVVAGLLLLGAGATATGIALALHGGEATDVLRAYRTGVAGQAGITLICLAYAPNLAVWATAYLVGPGFSVGVGTVVRVTDVTVGGLPAIPIFAGLPAGPLGGVGTALLGVPVAAGMAAGWLLARRRHRAATAVTPARWPALLAAAVVAGPVAGVGVGAAAAVSGGPLGDGRLAEVGPVAWQVAAVTAVVVAVGALAGAAAGRSFLGPAADRPR